MESWVASARFDGFRARMMKREEHVLCVAKREETGFSESEIGFGVGCCVACDVSVVW